MAWWDQFWNSLTAHVGWLDIGKWLADNFVALVGGTVAVFWLRKLRAEEALKARLQLVLEINEAFSELEFAVQRWSSPLVHGDTDKYAQFQRELSELTPAAIKALHRASLLLDPPVIKLLADILDNISKIRVEHENFSMLRGFNKAAPGSYASEMTQAFDTARKELPKKITDANEELRHSLRRFLLGPWQARSWKKAAVRQGLLSSASEKGKS